ncbi:YtxH domain-containing protein [Catenulispora subtropica]|uniref:Secreted protein n=1 Tax=Catenulispora subtropica TaxID=450798 RepID=A0ABP5CJP7_9ACTN
MKAGTKLTLAAGLGAGYVLGARAGREKYDKIVGAVRKVTEAPAVRQTANVIQVQAFEITRNTAAKGRETVVHVVEKVRHRGDHDEEHDGGSSDENLTSAKANGPTTATRAARSKPGS